MSFRLLTMSLVLVAGLVRQVAAKPPDLPQPCQVTCTEQPAAVIVGHIVIVGTHDTPPEAILSQVPFTSGQSITLEDLQAAERNLHAMDIFVRHNLQVLDPEGPSPVKDILITVQEKCGAVPGCAAVSAGRGKKTWADGCSQKACGKDQPKCSCAGECKCCCCQKNVGEEDAEVNEECTCKDDCKCCGCKNKIAHDGCKVKVCCVIACANADGCCPVPCLVLEEVFPALRLCRMCPQMEARIKKALRPCIASFVKKCQEILSEEEANPVKTGGKASVQAKPEKAKKDGAHCGQFKVRVGVCPLTPTKHKKHNGWFAWSRHQGKKPEKLRVMPQEIEEISVMPQEEVAKPASAGCPYRKQQETVENQPVYQTGLACTPLDNLEKLANAQWLMKVADECVRHGKFDQAEMYYEAVMQVCPGSRYAQEAATGKMLATATRDMWETFWPATEECEPLHQADPLPCDPCEEGVDGQAMQGFKEQFVDLLEQARCAMEAGHVVEAQRLAQEAAQLVRPDVAWAVKAAEQAFAAGCYPEAWEWVNRALMLHPDCLAAQDLQQKLIQVDVNHCEKGRVCPYSGYKNDDGTSCPGDVEENEPSDPLPCPGLGFRHDLPAVDPQVVEALERLLVEIANPYRFQAIESPEEPYYIDSEECELQLLQEELEAKGEVQFLFDAEHALRMLMYKMHQLAGVDLDGSQPSACIARVWLRVGNREFEMTLEPGHTHVWSAWHDEAQDDLRTLQAKHNEDILHWIESLSGGIPEEGDCEEAEEPLYQLETDLGPDW